MDETGRSKPGRKPGVPPKTTQIHTLPDGRPYWTESAYYEFTGQEINALEAATQELDKMCLAAVDHIIAGRRFAELQVPDEYVEYITSSWETDEHTIDEQVERELETGEFRSVR